MKPIKLFLQNIGPYLKEEIDFEKLDNMFLITGSTGSGKTFIFDAITYAIYGKLSSSRNILQSDFSAKTDEPIIELIFSVGSTKYRIKRILSYQYLNRHNKLSDKPESATFEVFDPKTKAFVQYDRNQNIQAINGYTEKIIGLKYSEFSKIVVLPQGAFAQFLKQSSADKSVTLEKLFPVSEFKTITQKVKDLAAEMRTKIEVLNRQIIDYKQNFDFATLENDLNIQKEKISQLDTKITTEEEKLSVLNENNQKLENKKETAVLYEKNKSELEKLNNEESSYNALLEEIQKATKALSLNSPLQAKNKSIKEFSRLSEKLIEIEEKEKNILLEFEKYEEEKDSIKKLEESIEAGKKESLVLKTKIEAGKRIEILKQNEQKLQNQIKNIEAQISTVDADIQSVNEQLSSIQKNNSTNIKDSSTVEESILLSLTENKNQLSSKKQKNEIELKNAAEFIELEKRINENKEKLVEEQKIKDKNVMQKENLQKIKEENIASFLAEKLQEGQMCPVCGSTAHPHPANTKNLSFEQKDTTLEEAISQAENLVNKSNQVISSLETKIEENANLLQKFKTEQKYEDLLSEKHQIENELKDIEKTISTANSLLHRVKGQKEEKEKILSEKREIENTLQKNQTEILTNVKEFFEEKEYNLQDLENQSKGLELSLKNNQAKVEEWNKSYKAVQETKITINVQKTEIQKEKDNYENEKNKNIEIFENQLKASIFTSEEELKSSLLDEDEIKTKQSNFDSWKNKKTEIEGYLKKTKYEGSSTELIRQIQEMQKQITGCKSQVQESKSEKDKLKDEYTRMNNVFEETSNKIIEKEKLEKENEPLFKLFDDLSGKNQINTPFEIWALATYFENVISYANIRFQEISNGRYKFLLGTGKDNRGQKGLDVSVLDSYNGKVRDSSSLSGGETFMASLSLALGLTDAVTSRNGGIQLDSLFIDEGFGTLDSETQEKAMETLNELQENKMVGIISHIELLKTSIRSQIKVEKTTAGSKIHINYS